MRVLLSIVMTVFLLGCDLFATRDPELPVGGSVPFLQPDRPEVVLTNLQNAVRSLNPQNYIQCISETEYEFQPAQVSVANNPGLWGSWSRQEELVSFNNLRAEAQNFQGHQLQFFNTRTETFSQTAVQVTTNYSLTIIHNRTAQGIPTVSSGEMVLTIVADSRGLWFIQQWTDINVGDQYPWSEFKALFFRG